MINEVACGYHVSGANVCLCVNDSSHTVRQNGPAWGQNGAAVLMTSSFEVGLSIMIVQTQVIMWR